MKNKLIVKRTNGVVVQSFLWRVGKDKKAGFTPKKQRETSAALFNDRFSDKNSDKNSAQK